jgi:hypothetical protein
MKTIPFRYSVEELSGSAHYANVVAKVESLAPIVPAFNYSGASNIEEIKFKLAQKAMHDLVMSILKGKADGTG